MGKKFGFSAVFIGAYLVFVIAMVPANWLLDQVKLPNNLVLNDVSGSIWHARIKTVMVDDIVVSNVESRLSPFSVLLFNPTLDVSFGDELLNGPEGVLTVSQLTSEVRVDDANILVPANIIATRLNLPIDVQAHEDIRLAVGQFSMGQPVCGVLQGQIEWENAAVTALDEKIALGKLTANLSCEKGELVATVVPNNELGLSYRAIVKKGGKLSGNGFIKPGEKFPRQLQDALAFIGKPDKQGRYHLTL